MRQQGSGEYNKTAFTPKRYGAPTGQKIAAVSQPRFDKRVCSYLNSERRKAYLRVPYACVVATTKAGERCRAHERQDESCRRCSVFAENGAAALDFASASTSHAVQPVLARQGELSAVLGILQEPLRSSSIPDVPYTPRVNYVARPW